MNFIELSGGPKESELFSYKNHFLSLNEQLNFYSNFCRKIQCGRNLLNSLFHVIFKKSFIKFHAQYFLYFFSKYGKYVILMLCL